MVLEGVVTNVAAFGAFVDVGVHQDGLVHVSAMADRFVSDPHEVVKSGQVVKVKVLEVDVERQRIGLTLRLNDDPQRPRDGKRPEQGGGARRDGGGQPRGGDGGNRVATAAARTADRIRTAAAVIRSAATAVAPGGGTVGFDGRCPA